MFDHQRVTLEIMLPQSLRKPTQHRTTSCLGQFLSLFKIYNKFKLV